MYCDFNEQVDENYEVVKSFLEKNPDFSLYLEEPEFDKDFFKETISNKFNYDIVKEQIIPESDYQFQENNKNHNFTIQAEIMV